MCFIDCLRELSKNPKERKSKRNLSLLVSFEGSSPNTTSRSSSRWGKSPNAKNQTQTPNAKLLKMPANPNS